MEGEKIKNRKKNNVDLKIEKNEYEEYLKSISEIGIEVSEGR